MGFRQVTFAPGEWYHIFNRGIDKQLIFTSTEEFKRFQMLLYLANSTEPVNIELQLRGVSFPDVFSLRRAETLVDVAAYCLMGNHPHLVIREKTDGGITDFMRKLGTAYTMYFNRRHDRIGNLMVKPFRARHIDDDNYLQTVVQYVHLNPAEKWERGWKQGVVNDMESLKKKLARYEFSSLPDYLGKRRNESAILDDATKQFISGIMPPLESVLEDVQKYYAELDEAYAPKPKGRPSKLKGDTF